MRSEEVWQGAIPVWTFVVRLQLEYRAANNEEGPVVIDCCNF